MIEAKLAPAAAFAARLAAKAATLAEAHARTLALTRRDDPRRWRRARLLWPLFTSERR